jgi:hypothetical protein
MRTMRLSLAALTAASLLASTVPANAGPTVIRDDQLRDLAVTPVLGRGYSIATNTFSSICLTDIVKTKPSYNFDYLFQQIEADGSTKSDSSTAVSANFSGGGWGIHVDASGSARVDSSTKETYYNHNMLVTIVIDVYYNSVDESKSALAPAALQLLSNGDVPGFFDACGMYYTRSIGRKAKFDSLFTYSQTTQERDSSFEAELQAQIRGWGQSGGFSVKSSNSFQETASKKQLTIKSAGFGLGKNESASLIAYDLDTFRNAVKSAFTAMQADDVGMVTSIEVAPWVENSEFQKTLKLEPADVKITDENGVVTTKRMLPYAQKRVLNQNSEFLSELDRAARGKLNVFYKAKQCRATIDFDYMKQDDKGVFASFRDAPGGGTWGDRTAMSHRVILNEQPQTLPLSDISKAVTLGNINLMFKEYDAFMYGGTDPAWGSKPIADLTSTNFPSDLFPGAAACVADLIDAGITKLSYRNVKSCQRVEERFAVVAGRIADDYCLPTLK